MVICDDVSVRDCCLDVLDVYETRILINFLVYIYICICIAGTAGWNTRLIVKTCTHRDPIDTSVGLIAMVVHTNRHRV